MELYKKNRLLFWLLLLLIVINLSALISFFFFMQKQPDSVCTETQPSGENVLQKELGLSDTQLISVEDINATYRRVSEPMAAAVREKRMQIMDELEKAKPDTNLLLRYTSELTLLQNNLQKENIRQYLGLKEICNPDQLPRLSELYRDLYGCPMKGKGMKHRYRHGQNKGK